MKKGQAAIEFLMTYGWAILLVLVAIGALAYFNVLTPSNFIPPDKSCEWGAAINYYYMPDGVVCQEQIERGMFIKCSNDYQYYYPERVLHTQIEGGWQCANTTEVNASGY